MRGRDGAEETQPVEVAHPAEQPLPAPEERRHQVDLHFVHKARPQLLLHRFRTAAHGDVLPAGGGFGLFEGRLDPVGDEVERGPVFHLE